jgi:hypothetical protein
MNQIIRMLVTLKHKILLLPVFILIVIFCSGQTDDKEQRTVFHCGVGAGLDYGGFGFKAEYLPLEIISIFAGAGFNLDKIGYNGGLSLKIVPKKYSTPTLLVMYGYNAVLKVQSPFGGAFFSQTYYGFSAGVGYDFNVGRKNNKISLAVLVPFRSSAFKDKYDALKAAGYKFKPDISNVLGSIGFNIGTSGKSK